jgi:hypothetical protein
MLIFLLLSLGCSTSSTRTNDGGGIVKSDSGLGLGGDSGGPGPADTGPSTEDCEDCPPSTVLVTMAIEPSLLTTNPERTQNNPLKGFMTSYLWGAPATDFSDQMEFLYLPMAELWDETGETLETGLEPHLLAAEARGHHAVVRVFIDYPSRESGLPTHLEDIVPCSPYTDHGGGCSPDYNHPALLDAMLGLISALGERYDGDRRLGFVQVGLLGFWGEWHTYPHTDWFPTNLTQTAVLDAFDGAFEVTQVQVRRAAANAVDLRMGFHDDSFAHSTLGEIDWFFLPGLESAGAAERWQSVAIGGELRPELQSSVFSDGYSLGTYAQDIGECIDQTHASYLLNYYAFNGDGHGYLGADRDRADAAAVQLGYQFELIAASATASGLTDQTIELSLQVELSQTGVAPFYYPLFLSVESPAWEASATSGVDLQELMPGEHRIVSFDLGRVPVGTLHEPIELTLESPMLVEGQRLLMATDTPWSTPTGPMVLQWEMSCVDGDTVYALGDIAGTTADGCDCLCDVDGLLRGCGGEACGSAVTP